MSHMIDEPEDKDGAGLEDKPSREEIEQIERERAQRLAPENRPPNAEVDNTRRTFDPAKGDFID